MIKFLKQYGWVLYFGITASAMGIHLSNWKYWVLSIPMIILVEWKTFK